MTELAAALLAAAGVGVDWFLLGRAPLSLESEAKKKYVAAGVVVNVWAMLQLALHGVSVPLLVSYAVLTNGLFLMAATDLQEKMVYDIHFYMLLLCGIITTLFSGALIGRILLFLILFGVLFLVSRKSEGLGFGDVRMIACLALYFSLNRWMEVMLLSLGIAMIYGVIGVLRKKRTMKSEIAFIPFLLAAVLIEFAL